MDMQDGYHSAEFEETGSIRDFLFFFYIFNPLSSSGLVSRPFPEPLMTSLEMGYLRYGFPIHRIVILYVSI